MYLYLQRNCKKSDFNSWWQQNLKLIVMSNFVLNSKSITCLTGAHNSEEYNLTQFYFSRMK